MATGCVRNTGKTAGTASVPAPILWPALHRTQTKALSLRVTGSLGLTIYRRFAIANSTPATRPTPTRPIGHLSKGIHHGFIKLCTGL
jgi:hypothetical protein